MDNIPVPLSRLHVLPPTLDLVFVQQEHGGSTDEPTKFMEHMVLDALSVVSTRGCQRAGRGLVCRILWGDAQGDLESDCGLYAGLRVWR